jgi:hypothetical protein
MNTETKRLNGHEYVDLGLPSGTLWAKCNVGAKTETDTGLYFTWGETEGFTPEQMAEALPLVSPFDPDADKKIFRTKYEYDIWSMDYYDNKLRKREYGFSKYNKYDKKYMLDADDDAAHVNMGGDWKMPSLEVAKELVNSDYVTKELVTNYNGTGVNGYLITSLKNGNHLFLPMAGSLVIGHLFDAVFNKIPSHPAFKNEHGTYLLNQLDSDDFYWVMSIVSYYNENTGHSIISVGKHFGGACRRVKYAVRGIITNENN